MADGDITPTTGIQAAHNVTMAALRDVDQHVSRVLAKVAQLRSAQVAPATGSTAGAREAGDAHAGVAGVPQRQTRWQRFIGIGPRGATLKTKALLGATGLSGAVMAVHGVAGVTNQALDAYEQFQKMQGEFEGKVSLTAADKFLLAGTHMGRGVHDVFGVSGVRSAIGRLAGLSQEQIDTVTDRYYETGAQRALRLRIDAQTRGRAVDNVIARFHRDMALLEVNTPTDYEVGTEADLEAVRRDVMKQNRRYLEAMMEAGVYDAQKKPIDAIARGD